MSFSSQLLIFLVFYDSENVKHLIGFADLNNIHVHIHISRLFSHIGTDVLLVTHDNELLVYGFNGQLGLCPNQKPNTKKQVFYDVNNLVKIEELSKKPIRGYTYSP